MRLLKSLLIGFSGLTLLASCGAGGDDQGTEYAPNMYHSVAYEPYTQIDDKDAGRWVTSIEYPDGHAEFYNSNKRMGMAMGEQAKRLSCKHKRKSRRRG